MVLLQNHSVGDTFFTLVGFISINFQINKEINASQTHGPKSGAFFSWGYKSYGLEGIKFDKLPWAPLIALENL